MTQELHVATFNAENFYLLLDRDGYTREELEALDGAAWQSMHRSVYNPNKSRAKIAAIAQTILDEDFDLVGLCEIGGLETLENFNRIYLESRYESYLHEENSRRGIFVGALVKKGVFDRVRAKSMADSFSRNLLKLELSGSGGRLTVFVVHLKSQRGDDRGIDQRADELARLAELVPRHRALVMGDFNGIAIRGMHQFEYEPFLNLPMADVLAARGVPPDERHSHYWFGNGGKHSQLDYIFCTHDIDVQMAEAIEDVVPHSREERFKLPSDHLFVHARIAYEKDPT